MAQAGGVGAVAGGGAGGVTYTAQQCWDKATYAADPDACGQVLFGSLDPTFGGFIVIAVSAILGFLLVEGAKALVDHFNK
jgi:hypothetical protein